MNVYIPSVLNKLFPKNGNPGRLAKTIIRKSGWRTIVESSFASLVWLTICLPSASLMFPVSTRFFSTHVTWAGALSASSITRT